MSKIETPAEVRSRLLRRLEVSSAELAITALEEVAADKKAPAPARATAGTALLRAAGYLERKDRESEKDPEEMTPEQLAAEIKRLENAGVIRARDDHQNLFD